MDVRFRTLDRWPMESTPAKDRREASTFRMHWNATLALLEDELSRLKARDIVIEVGLRSEDIRMDGWPRADAREPTHPGVAISFESKHGPLRYLTDAHERWRHNVHAIALSLQALRAVDRYGVTHRAEQYKGWAALPAGTNYATGVLFSVLGEEPHELSNGEGKELYRRALLKAHPDQGGDRETFDRVQAAAESLGLR